MGGSRKARLYRGCLKPEDGPDTGREYVEEGVNLLTGLRAEWFQGESKKTDRE